MKKMPTEIIKRWATAIAEAPGGMAEDKALAVAASNQKHNVLLIEGWRNDVEHAPTDGTPFLAKADITNIKTNETWTETHLIWCDDEDGSVHIDCHQGLELGDYSLWMHVPSSD